MGQNQLHCNLWKLCNHLKKPTTISSSPHSAGVIYEAFAVIVERYVSSIYKFSYRYVRNGPDAEYIAQETFLRAWKSLKKFDQSKNFKTWIFAIAKNASLDLLKKKKPMPFSRIRGRGRCR